MMTDKIISDLRSYEYDKNNFILFNKYRLF